MNDREHEIEQATERARLGVASDARRPFGFWSPVLILSSLLFALVLFSAVQQELYGWGVVFGLPLSIAVVYGYGAKRVRPLFTYSALFLLLPGSLISMIWAGSMGPVCALLVFLAMLFPLVFGLAIGLTLKTWLRASGFRHSIYFSVFVVAMPIGLHQLESALALPREPEAFAATRVIGATPVQIWNQSLGTANLDASVFERFGLPKAIAASGHATAIGNRKIFHYDKGTLEVEIVTSRVNECIEFRIIRQEGVEERGARLLDGSMKITAHPRGATITLHIRYEPKITPRWLCRWIEQWIATSAADRVLDWLESNLRGSEERISGLPNPSGIR